MIIALFSHFNFPLSHRYLKCNLASPAILDYPTPFLKAVSSSYRGNEEVL